MRGIKVKSSKLKLIFALLNKNNNVFKLLFKSSANIVYLNYCLTFGIIKKS